MAEAAAGITKRLPLFRDEFPSVLPRGEREFQHTERLPIPNFAIWSGKAEEIVAAAAGPSDNFPDSIRRIGLAVGVLRRKTFVGMLVCRKNQVGMRVWGVAAR